MRVATALDVHAFADEPRPLMLACLEFAPTGGLAGHSDADVGLHALTDALLGALGDGDIGTHFPPSDPQWKAADSRAFLRHCNGLLDARGSNRLAAVAVRAGAAAVASVELSTGEVECMALSHDGLA